MFHLLTRPLIPLLVLFAAAPASIASTPQGQIDAATLISVPQGTYNGVAYTRYEAMFAGSTSNNRPFRVPCQIIAPSQPSQGSGLMLFDWLVPSTIPTAIGQEQADGRYTMGDAFLFGRGISYATVRSCKDGIGRRSTVADFARPWSDGLLDTSSEFILSAGDEFDIVISYVRALRTDPVALEVLGQVQRRAAFGYSAAGFCVRGLMRMQAGVGLFDFAIAAGVGRGYTHPSGNGLASSNSERAPLQGAGLEIDVESETDVVALAGHKTRHEEWNYRVYQFAGASHLRRIEATDFGLPSPQGANTADWLPFFRAMFVAADHWCDGIQPPPTLWLGAPNEAPIARDAKGNALVAYVGGQPVNSSEYRLPEVAVGENQYIPFDPSFADGSFLGLLRALAGGHVDLTSGFTSHAAYVAQVASSAQNLVTQRYLLQEDADAIIQRAQQSSIGN